MIPDESSGGGPKKAQVNMRIDADLYERLKEFSSKSGVTITDIIVDAIRRVLDSPVESKEEKYKELMDKAGIYFPPPGSSDESILGWLSYRMPPAIYNVLVVLYDEGGEYQEYAFRITWLCKKNYPTKWMYIMDLFRAYRPELVKEFGINHTMRMLEVEQ
jgi:hypothetical protein